MGTTDGSWTYCGWNLDDVLLTGLLVAPPGKGAEAPQSTPPEPACDAVLRETVALDRSAIRGNRDWFYALQEMTVQRRFRAGRGTVVEAVDRLFASWG
ncbi:MAG: hypothetical protein JXB62_15725, partial [Pirellulales bacterium]|nr:hypothetical protein [Pirellulales bacterium]